MSGDFPRTEEEIATDFTQRRAGLLKALTDGGHAAATRKTGESDYTVVKNFKDTQDETLFVPAMQGG